MNDGGPAFPCDWKDFQPTTGEQVVREQFQGMSLRDYFAIHASDAAISAFMRKYGWNDHNFLTHAEARYRFADAMLLARTNKTT